jgi:hypothetical protein
MKKRYLFLFLVLVAVLSGALVQAQESRPETGTFVKDTLRNGYGELTIINNNEKMDGLAVLTTSNKHPLVAVYIRSNESFKIVGITDGTYEMYFKLGNKWDSIAKFEEKGGQYRLDRLIDFKTTWISRKIEYSSWTIPIDESVPNTSVAAGKVSVTEEEFPDLS